MPPATKTSSAMLSIIEAAARLQPYLGTVSAVYWLTDLRRAEPVYRERVFSAPCWVRHEGRIMYPEPEITRVVGEFDLFRRAKK
jgi:hypothetical protein